MLRFVGGCLGRLISLVLLVAVLGVAWYNRHQLGEVWARLTASEPEVSEAVAERAATELAGLGDDGAGRAVLHASELQSLIQYRWAALLPPELGSPRVGLGAGRVTLEGDVATALFHGIAELGEILSFLPDTTTLRAVASFVPLDTAHVAVEIHELGAAGVPIPRQLIPPILAWFAVPDAPGLGANAVAIRLPAGVGGVWVSGDSMVVAARGGGGT